MNRIAILTIFVFASLTRVQAGNVNISSVTASTLDQAATATYTFTVTPSTTITSGSGDGRYFWIDFDNDYTVNGANLDSITPNIPGMNIVGRNDSKGEIRMYSSSGSATISAGQQYVIVVSGIVNPTAAQTPDDHLVKTGDGNSVIDSGTTAAAAITAAATVPTATLPLPDYTGLLETDGVVQHIADLNSYFEDGDGDALTFSASSSANATVGVSTSGSGGRVLSIEGKQYGTAVITVIASSNDGAATNTFNVQSVNALAVNSISSSNADAGGTTDFAFNITLEETILNGGGWAILQFDFPQEYDITSSTITISSPSLSGSLSTTPSRSEIRFLRSPNIPAGTYTVTVNSVQNPGLAGDYGTVIVNAQDDDGLNYEQSAVTLPAIGAINIPTVVSGIADQILYQENGATQVSADLNNVFNDADGDTLSFMVLSGHDTSIATATINSDALTVTPVGEGTTSVSIRATDNLHGSVTNTFSVRVIGLLTPASVVPASLLTGTSGSYEINLRPSRNMIATDLIVVQFPATFDASSVTIASVSPGGFSLDVSQNAHTAVMEILSGGISSGTDLTIVLDNVVSPASAGNPGSYELRTQTSGNTHFGFATVAGHAFVDFDGDMDNIEDAWEILHFGGTNVVNGGPSEDFDSDQASNEHEYIAGTIPTDDTSRFEVLPFNPDTSELTWKSVTNRTYAIYGSTNLVTDVPGALIDNGIAGDPSGTNVYLLPPAADASLIYSVETELP